MPPSPRDALIEFAPVDWADLAGRAAGSVAEFYANPLNLSGLTGSVILPLMVFRHKPPLLPYLIVAAAGWAAGRMTWQASRDLRDIAAAARSGD